MKKFSKLSMCLCVLVTICSCLSNLHLKATDWTDLVSPPNCPGTITTEWGEPHILRNVLGDSYWGTECVGCVFQVVYYERWTGSDYDIYIAGIMSDDPSCNLCAQTKLGYIIASILWFKAMYEDYDFKASLNNNYIIDIYSKGTCNDDQGIICEEYPHCCKLLYQINFGGTSIPSGFFWPNGYGWPIMPVEEIIPPCLSQLCDSVKCKQIKFDTNPDICDLDCSSKKPWSYKYETITYPYCNPPCNITFLYRYRDINENCPYNYRDYQILNISEPIPLCCISLIVCTII